MLMFVWGIIYSKLHHQEEEQQLVVTETVIQFKMSGYTLFQEPTIGFILMDYHVLNYNCPH